MSSSSSSSTEEKQVKQVEISINGSPVTVGDNISVYEACRLHNVSVPTLCNHPRLPAAGKCRVCLVGITNPDGSVQYVPSCSTLVKKGMKIDTTSSTVKSMAKTALNDFLSHAPVMSTSHFHSKEMDSLLQWSDKSMRDDSSPSVTRDMSLCIGCTRCVRACTNLQGMSILQPNSDADAQPQILCQNNLPIYDTDCIACGQCASYCPTGAIVERDDTDVVFAAMKLGKLMVMSTAPAVRVAIAEEFGQQPGGISTKKLVGAARQAGFKYVFDTNFTADLTIMEEGSELLGRIPKGGPFPMFTSCCPGWINLVEKKYPQFIPNLSTCRSPQMMMGPLIKTFWAEKAKVNADDIFHVSIMPCTAKKDEIERQVMWRHGKKDVDVVLTTRELARLLVRAGVSDWKNVKEEEYDDPLGASTGAAALFGVTGGVMEAALRTAYELHTGEPLGKIEFQACRGLAGVKDAIVDVKGFPLHIAIVNGTKNTRDLLKKIDAGFFKDKPLHFVEVMACPGGCIGGGGQPRSLDPDILVKRMNAIYTIDERSQLRKSHENPSIKKIYEEFLIKPLGHKSHKLLHTTYTNRMKVTAEAKEVKKEGEAKTLLILYGSQGGTAANAARNFEAAVKKRTELSVRCIAMNEFAAADVAKESKVIFITSTFGEGEFPDNAVEFWNQLKDTSLAADLMKNVQFSVFGLGSTEYQKFCMAGKLLNQRMLDLGGKMMVDLACGDDKSPEKYYGAYDPWMNECFKHLGGMPESQTQWPDPKYKVSLALVSKNYKGDRPCPGGMRFCALKTNKVVTAPGYDREVRYIEIDLKGSGWTYKVGDHCGILPRNDPQQVQALLDYLGYDGSVYINVEPFDTKDNIIPARLTVRELFEQYMDLNAPPTRRYCELLSLFATDAQQRDDLRAYANPDNKAFTEVAQELTYETVLRKYNSCMPPIDQLISLIPVIKPRWYSIGSSSMLNPDQVQHCIVIYKWKTPKQVWRTGLCTSYLFRTPEKEKLAIAIRKGILVPPKDTKVPIIMMGLGTGIAPFRGFLQERLSLKQKGAELGKAILYFSVRNRDKDFILEQEFKDYKANGIFTELYPIFSFDKPQTPYPYFITHLIHDHPKDIWDYISQPTCQLFYCGPAMGIPEAIQDKIKEAAVSVGKMTTQQAQEWMANFIDPASDRYHVECF